ncbi:hypothetical protein SK128_026315 [Halocaridina rubra]|uniref:Uncharacterized protein n=1 Tax=Halocaridina rubra TaxID=373956 RepID=A0AAN8WJ55_HALRR
MRTHLAKLTAGITVWCLGSVSMATREGRYLFINSEAPITLGFILNMPISLALPKLIKQSMKGRSFDSDYEEYIDFDEQLPEELDWDPAYEQELNRLSIYFGHMEIFSLSCQEKLICELASESELFSPISDIFLKELKVNGLDSSSVRSEDRSWVSSTTSFYASPSNPLPSVSNTGTIHQMGVLAEPFELTGATTLGVSRKAILLIPKCTIQVEKLYIIHRVLIFGLPWCELYNIMNFYPQAFTRSCSDDKRLLDVEICDCFERGCQGIPQRL